MTLVGEAELSREPSEVALAAGKALHRRPDAEAHAVSRDGRAGRGAEDPAQVVRRDGGLSGELRQRASRVGREDLTRSFDERTTRLRGCRTPRRDWTWIVLLERMSGKDECTLDEPVRIVSPACCCEQQPVFEIDFGRRGQRTSWKRWLAAHE
jgi:hypothetical protein